MKIACVQMDIIYGEPEINFAKAEQYIKGAAKAQADMIVLPEMWNTGYCLNRLETLADRNGFRTTQMLSRLAKKHHVYIIGGSTAVEKDGRFYNTMYIADKNGAIIAQYDKAHLFRLMDEHLFISPGQKTNMFSMDGILCGGVICYDLRFPEWIRTHVLNGAKIVFIPAQWPAKRMDHWRILLQARAIENQCFIVAVNRIGSDPANEFNGQSMVINPWGEILLNAETAEGIYFANLELTEVNQVRRTIPIFLDRRTDLY